MIRGLIIIFNFLFIKSKQIEQNGFNDYFMLKNIQFLVFGQILSEKLQNNFWLETKFFGKNENSNNISTVVNRIQHIEQK